MSLTFAIADLHGRFDLLKRAYGAISAYGPEGGGKIVHLGDYVDRGPSSRQIIEFLMDAATVPDGFTRICLMGNHEDMMVETLTKPLEPEWWVGNGGAATLSSYHDNVPKSHLEWMRALPKLHFDAYRVFAHAAVDPTKSLSDQTDAMLLWFRYPDGFSGGWGDKHLVHGHTPSPRGPEFYSGRTNLDTYAWRTGKLFVAVFDDAVSGGPVSLLNASDDVGAA